MYSNEVWVLQGWETSYGHPVAPCFGLAFSSYVHTRIFVERTDQVIKTSNQEDKSTSTASAYCWMNHFLSKAGGFFNQNSPHTFCSFKCSIDKSTNWILQGSIEDSPGGLLPISSLVGKSAFRCHVIWNSRRPCLWVTGCDSQKSISTQHRQNSFQPRAH